MATKTAIRDEEVLTDIVDYGVPRRDRPKLGKVSYKELKSGSVTIADRKVRVSSLSSLKTARTIAETLKSWIENASFYLSAPVECLPMGTVLEPMKQSEEISFVGNVMHKAITCKENEEIETVAKRIIAHSANHIVVVDDHERVSGIVTSWDITRATAEERGKLAEIISKIVVTTTRNETLEEASPKWHNTKYPHFQKQLFSLDLDSKTNPFPHYKSSPLYPATSTEERFRSLQTGWEVLSLSFCFQ